MSNEWHDRDQLDLFIEAIRNFSNNEEKNPDNWIWWKNGRCKYVSLRFDMRDGAFILQDRNGERITLDQLRNQGDDDDE